MQTEKRIAVAQESSVCPVCGAEPAITEEKLDGYGGGYYIHGNVPNAVPLGKSISKSKRFSWVTPM